eukprot:g576.t1
MNSGSKERQYKLITKSGTKEFSFAFSMSKPRTRSSTKWQLALRPASRVVRWHLAVFPGKKAKWGKTGTRVSSSPRSDKQSPLKERKQNKTCITNSDFTKNGSPRLLALPVDLWRCIRDCIGWTKLSQLARVCKQLAGLVKNPQLWKGSTKPVLDLSKFRNGEPLVALGEVWRQSAVCFAKVIMSRQTTDTRIELLTGIHVQHLSLRRCRRITDAALAHLSGLRLQRLDLAGCNKITDAGLAHLSALSLLQDLDLDSCDRITDAGLAHLSALPIQYLNLHYCCEVTDAGLAHLSALPLLYLNVVSCRKITDAGLAAVPRECMTVVIAKLN